MTSAKTEPALIITIDGPAGTGKSTVANLLARRLGLEFLDTGAMYRAAALMAIERPIDPNDGAALARAVDQADLHFDWAADPPRMLMGGRDISGRIRELDVSRVVSIVASQAQLRHVLVEQQRRIAQRHPRLVTEGRDQGSVVFPDAPVRFYIDAEASVRAARRAAQLVQGGKTIDPQRVLREICERDQLDASRADGPLKRPEGAVVIDTSNRTIEQVVDVMEAEVRGRLPAARLRP